MRKLIIAPDGISPFDKEGVAKINLGDTATNAELAAEEVRLVAEWESNNYQRDRINAYNALNQFELISDDSINGTTTHKDAILAIKAKFPKP